MTFKEFLKLVFIGCGPCILSALVIATIIMLITENVIVILLLSLLSAVIIAFLLIKWIEYLAKNNKI
jgi:hypothetical protein